MPRAAPRLPHGEGYFEIFYVSNSAPVKFISVVIFYLSDNETYNNDTGLDHKIRQARFLRFTH